MRSFLTYVLAALAAAVSFGAVQASFNGAVGHLATGLATGDPRLMAGAISEFLVLSLVALVLFSVLGCVIALVFPKLFSRTLTTVQLPWIAVLGGGVSGILGSGFWVAILGGNLNSMGVGAETATGQDLLLTFIVLVTPAWVLSGAVWGLVLRVSAPKPENTGIAA